MGTRRSFKTRVAVLEKQKLRLRITHKEPEYEVGDICGSFHIVALNFEK